MKILKSILGNGPTHYFVEGSENWSAMQQWLINNDVDYIQEACFGGHGESNMTIGVSIRKNHEWFALKWL